MADESFALPEQRPVFSQETAQAVGPQVGVTGGNIRTGFELRDPSKDGPTLLDSIVKLGLKYGNEKVAEWEAAEKDRKFMQGMTRAASGVAAKEIEAEQPWWSKMFGTGDEVKGARAWEGISDSNRIEASVLENMKTLRALPPDQIGDALVKIGQGMRSDDPTRNAAQSAMLVKAMPHLLKLHAKEHRAYLQEQAVEEQRVGIQSTFEKVEQNLRVLRSPGIGSNEDFDHAETVLRDIMTPPPSANPDVYKAQVVEGLANRIEAGDFMVYQQARSAGMLQGLPRQHQRALDALYDKRSREELLARVSDDVLNQVALLSTLDAKQIPGAIAAINRNAAESTGIDTPLIPQTKRISLTSQALYREAQEEEAAGRRAEAQRLKDRAKAAETAAQEVAAAALAKKLVLSSDPDSLKGLAAAAAAGDTTSKLANAAVLDVVTSQWNTPDMSQEVKASIEALPVEQREGAVRSYEATARAQLIQKDGPHLSAIRSVVREQLNTGSFDAAQGVVRALAAVAASDNGKVPKAFAKVVPEQHQALMSMYVQELYAAPVDPKTGERDERAAWDRAEARLLTTPAQKITKAETAKIDSAIKAANKSGDFLRDLFTDNLGSTQMQNLTRFMATAKYDGRVQSNGVDAAAVAVERAREEIRPLGTSGLAFIGNGQTEVPRPGGKYPSATLSDYGQTDEERHLLDGTRVGNAMKAILEARGVAVDSAYIYRADDTADDKPVFIIPGRAGRGVIITMDDLLTKAREQNKLTPAQTAGSPIKQMGDVTRDMQARDQQFGRK